MLKSEIENRLNDLKNCNGVWISLNNSKTYGVFINEIVNLPNENCIYLKTQKKKIKYSDIGDIMIL